MKKEENNNLEKSLALLEQGKTVAEISAMFPDSKEELEEYLDLAKWIETEGNDIRPPKEALQRILANLTEPVMGSERISIFSRFHFLLDRRAFFPIGAVAIFLFMFATGTFDKGQTGLNPSQGTASKTVSSFSAKNTVGTTDELADRVVGLLIESALAEENVLSNTDSKTLSAVSVAPVATDTSDITQIYNENEI